MKNLFIKVQALVLAIFMALSLGGCKKESKEVIVPKNLTSIESALDNKEIANMTTLDNELKNGNDSICYITNDIDQEQFTITSAFDKVMKYINIIDIMPDLSEYNMDSDKSPLSREAVSKLTYLSIPEIEKLIEDAKYNGKDFNLIERAQEARKKLFGLNWYTQGWLKQNGYRVCKDFASTLLRCAVADEFDVESKDVSFTMTSYLETEDDEDFTEHGILIIKVNTEDGTKEFRIAEAPGNPLFEVARVFSKAEYYATNRSILDENDYRRMVGYYNTFETMLASGVNLSNGNLVPQNNSEYAGLLLGNR